MEPVTAYDKKPPLGEIHSPRNIKRMAMLGANETLLRNLKYGFRIELNDNVDYHRCQAPRNNLSVINNLEEVRKVITKWLDKGFIEDCTDNPEKVKIVNALSWSQKIDLDTYQVKGRLCLDASRTNDYVQSPNIKLPEISYFLQHVEEGDYLMSIDIVSFFFHF